MPEPNTRIAVLERGRVHRAYLSMHRDRQALEDVIDMLLVTTTELERKLKRLEREARRGR